MKYAGPIRQGGLFRCCIETVYEHEFDAEPKEGDVLPCRYGCQDDRPTVIFRNGAWEWIKARALEEKP